MKIDWSKLTPAQLAEVKLQIDAADAKKGWPKWRGASLKIQTELRGEVMLAGAADTTKTSAMLWALDTFLRETPNAHAAIVRKVRADMTSAVLKTWARISAIRGAPKRAGGLHAEWDDYENGARVYFYGLDRHSKALGTEWDALAIDQAEELTEEEWGTLASRTSGRGAIGKRTFCVGACNPGPPSHWILSRSAMQDNGRPGPLTLLASHHEDNPELFDDYGVPTPAYPARMESLDALPGVLYKRLRKGLWVSAEGVVYEGFDRDLHVIPPFEIPQNARRFRAIDFGFTHPFACLWGYIDPDGRIYIYRELHHTKRRLDEHIAQIKHYSKGEEYELGVADSEDAEGIATLCHHNIPMVPVRKGTGSVKGGIQLVAARLAKAGDGKPRLFFFSDCLIERDMARREEHKPTCAVEEFAVYQMKPGTEEPDKKNDDSLSALRYAVMEIDHWKGSEDEDDIPERTPYFEQARPFQVNRVFGNHARVFGSRLI